MLSFRIQIMGLLLFSGSLVLAVQTKSAIASAKTIEQQTIEAAIAASIQAEEQRQCKLAQSESDILAQSLQTHDEEELARLEIEHAIANSLVNDDSITEEKSITLDVAPKSRSRIMLDSVKNWFNSKWKVTKEGISTGWSKTKSGLNSGYNRLKTLVRKVAYKFSKKKEMDDRRDAFFAKLIEWSQGKRTLSSFKEEAQ